MRRLFIALGLSLLAGCASKPPRKYVVFFCNNSVELDSAAQNVVSEAASLARQNPSGIVKVEGYAGVGNDLSADSLLAIQRAKLVRQQIIDDGVDAQRVVQMPRPPSNTEASAVGARRVEIELSAK